MNKDGRFGDETSQGVGLRLRLTRQALGLKQVELCATTGIAQNTYNQYETGRTKVGIENAILLCNAFGLTLDWLYRADIGSLKHNLAHAITAMVKARDGSKTE